MTASARRRVGTDALPALKVRAVFEEGPTAAVTVAVGRAAGRYRCRCTLGCRGKADQEDRSRIRSVHGDRLGQLRKVCRSRHSGCCRDPCPCRPRRTRSGRMRIVTVLDQRALAENAGFIRGAAVAACPTVRVVVSRVHALAVTAGGVRIVRFATTAAAARMALVAADGHLRRGPVGLDAIADTEFAPVVPVALTADELTMVDVLLVAGSLRFRGARAATARLRRLRLGFGFVLLSFPGLFLPFGRGPAGIGQDAPGAEYSP